MSSVPEGTYAIVNLLTNTCLQADNGASTTGQLLVGSSPTPDEFQQWYVKYDTGKAAYSLQNVASGLYASTKQTQTPAIKTYQTDTAPDYFNLVTGTASGTYFIYQTENPTMLFDLSKGSGANNTSVIFNTQTSPLTTTANQQWRFTVSIGTPASS